MTTTATKLVNQAKSWLGANEADGSHKKIIDCYNNHKPLAQGYLVKYSDAWCATFVSACAIKCGATDIIPTECSCPRIIELAKAKGIWIEDESKQPKKGDLILYDWDDNGVGNNKGNPEHIGIVTQVRNGSITVIEGNCDNAVKYRTIPVNGRYIRGFIRPKYQAAAKATTEKAATEKTTETKAASFSVGDKVKLKSGACYYGGGKIPSWLFSKTLYVRQVNDARIVISTQRVGAVTGAVEKKWLKKV